MLEERTAARFGTSETPASASAGELILPRAYADQSAQLTALKESIELLDIAPEAMVVADDYLPARLLCRRENPFHTARGQRQRPLAQNVHLGLERAQHVRLVQVVRRSDDDRVDLVELQQILDVGEHIGDLHSLGDRTCLGAVVVTERDELRPFDLGQRRQVGEL